jgi:hypothetical protein
VDVSNSVLNFIDEVVVGGPNRIDDLCWEIIREELLRPSILSTIGAAMDNTDRPEETSEGSLGDVDIAEAAQHINEMAARYAASERQVQAQGRPQVATIPFEPEERIQAGSRPWQTIGYDSTGEIRFQAPETRYRTLEQGGTVVDYPSVHEDMDYLVFRAIEQGYNENSEWMERFFNYDSLIIKRETNQAMLIMNGRCSAFIIYDLRTNGVLFCENMSNSADEARHYSLVSNARPEELLYFPYEVWYSLWNENHNIDFEEQEFTGEQYDVWEAFSLSRRNFNTSEFIVGESAPIPSSTSRIGEGWNSRNIFTKMLISRILYRLQRHDTINMAANSYFAEVSFVERPWYLFIKESSLVCLETNFDSAVTYDMTNGRSSFTLEEADLTGLKEVMEAKRKHHVLHLDPGALYTALRYSGREGNIRTLTKLKSLWTTYEAILEERNLEAFTDEIVFPSKWEAELSKHQEGSYRWCVAKANLNDDRETLHNLDYIMTISNTAQLNTSDWNFQRIFFDTEDKIRGERGELNGIILKDRASNEFLGLEERDPSDKPTKLTSREMDEVLESMYEVLEMEESKAKKAYEEVHAKFKKAQQDLSNHAIALKNLKKSLGHVSDKDDRSNIRKAMERIAKSGAFTFEGLKDGVLKFRNVHPFVLRHTEGAKTWKINIGIFDIDVRVSDYYVKLQPIDENETPFHDYWHPYLPRGRSLCFGVSQTKQKNYCLVNDLYSLLILVRDLMCSYDPSNPHCAISVFIDAQQQVDEANNSIKKLEKGTWNEDDFKHWRHNFNKKFIDNNYYRIAVNKKRELLFNHKAHEYVRKEYF